MPGTSDSTGLEYSLISGVSSSGIAISYSISGRSIAPNMDGQLLAILVLILPILVPGISLTARRLHDFNQSGWMQCIFLPGFFADELLGTGYVIYILTFVIFAFYCSQKSTNSKNKFGPKPKK